MTNSSAPETRTDAPEADAKPGEAAARDSSDPGSDMAQAAEPSNSSNSSPPSEPSEESASSDADAAEKKPPRPRPEVTMRLFGRTDVGQVREHNEDNFIVADLTRQSRGLMETDRTQVVGERGQLLGVCDGMGGAAAGEVASQLAVDIIYQRMILGDAPKDHDELAARLVYAIEAAGLRIFSEAKADRSRRGMGTTATIAALMDDHLFLGQVGDSRAYIYRGDRLVQVTRDQSLVNQLIEAGQLTEEEAETFEHNNIILQALGTADTVQVDLTYVLLRKGDVLMLCSDGLSGMVRGEEIREVLRATEDPIEICKALTDRANQAGGHDNITVVAAKFDGPGLEEPTPEDIEGLKYQKYQLPEPPPSTAVTLSEPGSRKGGKMSSRPPARLWGDDDRAGEGEGDEDTEDAEGDSAVARRSSEDPIHVPIDGAPKWLLTMMIAAALACITIAGYYLLR